MNPDLELKSYNCELCKQNSCFSSQGKNHHFHKYNLNNYVCILHKTCIKILVSSKTLTFMMYDRLLNVLITDPK